MKLNIPAQSYWEDKFTETLVQSEKIALQIEAYSNNNYNLVLNKMLKKIRDAYNRWGTNSTLSQNQASQYLNPEEYIVFQNILNLYITNIEKYNLGRYTEGYINTLKDLQKKRVIRRIETIITDIIQGFEIITADIDSNLPSGLQAVYSYSYLNGSYIIQTGTTVGYGINIPNEEYIPQLYNTAILDDKKSIPDRLWGNVHSIEGELKKILEDSIIEKWAIDKLEKEISNKAKKSNSEVNKIIRTESNRFANQAIIDACNNSGYINYFQHVSILDGVTSEICTTRSGAIIKYEDLVLGVTQPPLHPYCRSFLIPFINQTEIDGENYFYVDPNTTYEDWANIISKI